MTAAITGAGGRLSINENPIAWGIDTRVSVAAAIRSDLNLDIEYVLSSEMNGKRNLNMFELRAATSSVI